MKHRAIPREHVNAQPFLGRRNIMQEVAERVGVTIAGTFRRELHAAVDTISQPKMNTMHDGRVIAFVRIGK
ncbi:hypothetical protein [Caballeronia sp. dw_19]|uniref:hypothetical protein n=1 Tax=Caballeronia sp. dw_19 TaxID=2719791 RepID=UPI001BD3649A|nr:hypothetical protein [Caballeronia sp. dw_19]